MHQPLLQLEAVHFRQLQIEQQATRFVIAAMIEKGLRRSETDDAHVHGLEQVRDRLTDAGFIVHEIDDFAARIHAGTCTSAGLSRTNQGAASVSSNGEINSMGVIVSRAKRSESCPCAGSYMSDR
jgi:hypothetical protein